MNRKDVCPCCGHAIPPLRVRIAYGGLPECPHCGSHCGLPPRPLLGDEHLGVSPRWRWLVVALLLWVGGVGVALWITWQWSGPSP